MAPGDLAVSKGPLPGLFVVVKASAHGVQPCLD